MRVVLWGTADVGKPRVRILLQGLREQGIEVVECRADPWAGIEDKSQLRGVAAWARLASRLLLAYPVLVWRYLRAPPHDWVLLCYPSMPDVFVIRVFARLRGTRIALDWFLSAYDTIVLDRALVSRANPLARLVHAVEWLGIRLADVVFMDTATHARRMEALFGLAPGRCGHVWVGAETSAFQAPAAPSRDEPPGRRFRVLFYGQFIPLHGLAVIIDAARRLRGAPIDWLVIGRGQEAPRIRGLLDADPLPAVQWIEWVPYRELAGHIADADLCLGIFGTSDKAASVIPNKVFQVVAMGRPLVTRDSPAIRELLQPAPPCTTLVPAGDPAALADAVLQASRMHANISPTGCHAGLHDAISPRAIGAQLVALLGAHPSTGATE